MLIACASGAAMDVGLHLLLSGRKVSLESIAGAAGRGCVDGLIGAGVGALLKNIAKVLDILEDAAKAARAARGTEIVQRAMSRNELEAIRKSGVLSRGGRSGPHHVSDAVNSDPLRARQRLS